MTQTDKNQHKKASASLNRARLEADWAIAREAQARHDAGGSYHDDGSGLPIAQRNLIAHERDYYKERYNATILERDMLLRQRNVAWGNAEALAEALREVELRMTQARIASGIGKKKNQTEFLLGELERTQQVARDALAKWEGAE